MSVVLLAQHAYHIGLGVPAVNHHRQPMSPAQLEMADEPFFLHRERRTVPVAVESRFSDADNPWMTRQRTDAVPVPRRHLRQVVGMYPHRGHHIRMLLGQPDTAFA